MKNLLPNFNARIQRLRSHFKTWKVDALLITNPTDIFYCTGAQVSTGTYIVTKKDTYLFVDGRYFERLKAFKGVHLNTELESFYKKSHILALGFDEKYISYFEYQKLKKIHLPLQPLDRPALHVRAVKDAYEVQKIAKACKLCMKGVHWIIEHLHTGVQEKELASGLEIFFKQHGADGLSFEPIIAFGKNSAYPHYRAGDARLKKNDSVQIDIGVVLDGYHSDVSRVHFFGEPSQKIQEIYAIVQYAHDTAVKQCKAGITSHELDQIARNIITKAAYGDFFVHGLGHGVGLDIHELPAIRKDLDVTLQENMVITIEPGIYLPGIGGIRIEDTVLVQKNSCKILTK